MTEQVPIEECDDCNSTGFYQPLMRPRERCRTCAGWLFAKKVKDVARRAVEIEKTAPPGDVLIGAAGKHTEWLRRHPVVGTPPSEHQADCLCASCEYNRHAFRENPVSLEERIRESRGGVVEIWNETRNGKIWKIIVYASGDREEVDTGIATTPEPERSCVGGSQLLKPGEEGVVVLTSPVRGQIRRMFVGAYKMEDSTGVSALVLKTSQADWFPMFVADFTTDVGVVNVGVAILTMSPIEVHFRNILNVPVVVHATLEIEKK